MKTRNNNHRSRTPLGSGQTPASHPYWPPTIEQALESVEKMAYKLAEIYLGKLADIYTPVIRWQLKEDLVQLALLGFIKAYNHGPTSRCKYSTFAWTCGNNEIISWLKSYLRECSKREPVFDESAEDPSTRAQTLIDELFLRQHLAWLPADQCDVVDRWMHGQPPREIAPDVGKTVKEVQQMKRSAFTRLRGSLAEKR